MKYTRTVAIALAIAVLSGGSAVSAKEYDLRSTNGTTTATTTLKTDNGLHKGWLKQGRVPGLRNVIGTVTAINGTTITITGENGEIYSVNASSTNVVRSDKATSSLASLAVGDKVVVKGSITGMSTATTSIDAKVIFEDIGRFFKMIGEKLGQLLDRLNRNNG